MLASSIIEIIKKTVNDLLLDPEIILFGSYARGEAHPWSDYDLLIVLNEPIDITTRLLYQSKIRRSLARKDILSDVIIQSRADLEVKRILPGHIVQSALIEGIRL